MKLTTFLAGAATTAALASAQSVTGKAEGFASGVTGGGDATPVYPADVDELKELLTSDDPQVIVLKEEFNFIGTEGTTTGKACVNWGTGDACQQQLDTGSGCGDKDSVDATYDNAGKKPIDVTSNKTLLGEGSNGVIRGKGLRFRANATNIIVQNIKITELNPKYVWGGDGLSFDESDLIWIDHVTTSETGRVHYVFGHGANSRIELSNNFINGSTPYSTACDGYQYWGMELVGADDQITFRNNYLYKGSGRSPALSGSTLFHACNNVWDDNNGHAIEGDTNGQGLFEGNAFIDVKTVADDTTWAGNGQLFSSPDATTNKKCEEFIGRACVENKLENSGTFEYSDTAFMANFTDATIPACQSVDKIIDSVPKSAGNTL
ncbi:polysaccharide lyase family 1 protein [Aplosporella prunicola CBS 121167]|uniref:pectin lyase n=1 Tax=Aplosporella prunicola CBS 121167 TaxID=1176127 RepID=A0A6A6AXN7_9PEZI|nr:polysaccharide lyase family 1 protein [Aplosporella prunicola CBS 121167]KAF2135745.1 polysaccharide lyase family 1 protein [Aplosporella prunicola CBS 121167]